MFVKICGVRTLEDALMCAEAGAAAIGFNFWPSSPRYLAVEEAARIANGLPRPLRRWGVFVDAPLAVVERAFALGAIDLAQLHGDESPDYCQALAGRYLKAVRLGSSHGLEALERYGGELLLVDADQPAYGGSGRPIDLALARAAAARRRILLAGGLTPDSVAAAVRAVRPYGVDVASGVERAPGVKDRRKVEAFIAAAQGALAHG